MLIEYSICLVGEGEKIHITEGHLTLCGLQHRGTLLSSSFKTRTTFSNRKELESLRSCLQVKAQSFCGRCIDRLTFKGDNLRVLISNVEFLDLNWLGDLAEKHGDLIFVVGSWKLTVSGPSDSVLNVLDAIEDTFNAAVETRSSKAGSYVWNFC